MMIHSIEDLLVHELKDLYSAECQIISCLEKLVGATSDAGLIQSLQFHLKETVIQVERLERCAQLLNCSLKGHKCEGMEGLVREGEHILRETREGDVRDAALIGILQRMEHYEIAGYGTARALANLLGRREVADQLSLTLDEEGTADKLLTRLSERINQEAR